MSNTGAVMPKWSYSMLVVVALLAGCSSPQPPEAWSPEQPATITHPDCPEGAECSLGLMFDDTHVEIRCIPVIEGVTQEVIAVGNDGYPVGQARRVDGVAPRLLVAVANDHGLCGDDAPWVAGIVSDLDRSLADELTLSIAACDVLDRPYDEMQTCDQGGPARNQTESDEMLFYEYAWFPDVVASVNRDLAAGAGRAFRRDPAAVIAEYERRGFPACFEEQEEREVCRIGHTDLPADPEGTVVVSGVTQTRTPGVGFRQNTLQWTLEQLGDGPGWWITSKTSQVDGPTSIRDANDRWERCCPNVITEIHNGADTNPSPLNLDTQRSVQPGHHRPVVMGGNGSRTGRTSSRLQRGHHVLRDTC